MQELVVPFQNHISVTSSVKHCTMHNTLQKQNGLLHIPETIPELLNNWRRFSEPQFSNHVATKVVKLSQAYSILPSAIVLQLRSFFIELTSMEFIVLKRYPLKLIPCVFRNRDIPLQNHDKISPSCKPFYRRKPQKLITLILQTYVKGFGFFYWKLMSEICMIFR